MTNKEATRMLERIKNRINFEVTDAQKKMDALNMAIQALEEIDTLEQEPKTGHWIEEDMFDGDVAYRCSECNELFWIESGTPKDNGYDFCPKCGARMNGGNNDGR